MTAFLVEFLPILSFFVTYKFYDIYIATIVCIAFVILQMLYSFFVNGKIEKVQLITVLAIIILGSTTILLHDEMFIKWKPTVLYWIFSFAFILSKLFFKQTLAEKIMQNKVMLSSQNWVQLNNICAVFFMLMGLINLWVVYNFSTNVWVNFKLFGGLGLSVLFSLIVAIFIQKNTVNEL